MASEFYLFYKFTQCSHAETTNNILDTISFSLSQMLRYIQYKPRKWDKYKIHENENRNGHKWAKISEKPNQMLTLSCRHELCWRITLVVGWRYSRKTAYYEINYIPEEEKDKDKTPTNVECDCEIGKSDRREHVQGFTAANDGIGWIGGRKLHPFSDWDWNGKENWFIQLLRFGAAIGAVVGQT